jgi:hypothetical protein
MRSRKSRGFGLLKGGACWIPIEKQLTHEPAGETGKRKMLSGLVPPWEQVRPVWQLRVGGLRVFYDVDESARVVIVRAVRRKERKRTEEIL